MLSGCICNKSSTFFLLTPFVPAWNNRVTFFTGMDCKNTFVNFLQIIADEKLQKDLFKILNRKSPFANFKAEVETSDYRL